MESPTGDVDAIKYLIVRQVPTPNQIRQVPRLQRPRRELCHFADRLMIAMRIVDPGREDNRVRVSGDDREDSIDGRDELRPVVRGGGVSDSNEMNARKVNSENAGRGTCLPLAKR